MKRVLLLHREGVSNPFRDRFDAAFAEASRGIDSVQIDLYQETIESDRFPGPDQARLARNYLKGKYADRAIDVLVAVGDVALTFARDNREIFGNPSIVAVVSTVGQFEGRQDNVTGLQGGISFAGTIELALALRPNTQQVFVVFGARDDVWQSEPEFERVKEQIRPVSLVYLRHLPLTELVSRVEAIPERSVVLFVRQTMWDQSEDMDQFEGLSRVVRASPVPVFGIFEHFVGRGIVGGQVWLFETDARRLAAMAGRIASGASARDIAPEPITNSPIVDWRQLQRWQINEERLPTGTIVMSRPLSFFSQYGRYVGIGLLIVSAQFGLIAGLLLQRRRRQRAEGSLRESEERFRVMADTAPVMIWCSGVDQRCDYFNRPWLDFRGRSLDQELGEGWIDGLHPEDRERCVTTYVSAFDRREPFRMEYRLKRADGQYRWVLDTGVSRPTSDGTFTGYIGSCIDITERKAAEQSLRDNEAALLQSHAQIQDLAGRLIRAQEAERTRIARDLHDDVCQDLAAVTVDISYLRQHGGSLQTRDVQDILVSVQGRTESVAEGIRLLSHGLHPSVLHHIGLVAALQAHCVEVERQHQLQVTVAADGETEPASQFVALSLFRIAQEALHNSVRHGHARNASLSLRRNEADVTLSIADDGSGFDVAVARHHTGLGLLSIEERTRLIKGRVAVSSTVGHGTTIEARVPVGVFDRPDGRASDDPVEPVGSAIDTTRIQN